MSTPSANHPSPRTSSSRPTSCSVRLRANLSLIPPIPAARSASMPSAPGRKYAGFIRAVPRKAPRKSPWKQPIAPHTTQRFFASGRKRTSAATYATVSAAAASRNADGSCHPHNPLARATADWAPKNAPAHPANSTLVRPASANPTRNRRSSGLVMAFRRPAPTSVVAVSAAQSGSLLPGR